MAKTMDEYVAAKRGIQPHYKAAIQHIKPAIIAA